MQSNKSKRRKNGSGYVYKVKDTFYLQYRNDEGRKCTLTLKTPSGKKITEERAARAAAEDFLIHRQKVDEIETREEYLEKKAKLKRLKARLTITLDDAFDLHLQKPHTRFASPGVLKVARRYWEDFVCYVKEQFGLQTLDQVERVHAEAYIAYIRKNGRFNTKIRYNKDTAPRRKPFKEYESGGLLSNTTLNRYQSTCKAVFTFLSTDLGYTIEENPFFHIKPLKLEPIDREIFTDEELSLIFKNPSPLMRALFTIGICTGLRLGDVATLRWSDIEMDRTLGEPVFLEKEINRVTRKTKVLVHIPIEYELAEFLSKQWHESGQTEYVLPEAAEMYLSGSHLLNNRILSYIKSLGIEKYRIIPGRKRKQSVKDFHSLRHCFCYYAGIRGVPLPIVQSIVGHLTQAMTKHYQSHADRAARLQGIALMRGLISADGISPEAPKSTADVLRDRIVQFVRTANEMQVLQLNVVIDKLASNEWRLEIPIQPERNIPEQKLLGEA